MKLPLFQSALWVMVVLVPILRGNTANIATPREGGWLQRHGELSKIAAQSEAEVLFLGDSITEHWRTPAPAGGKAIWDQTFAPLKCLSLGISGDRTQHLLWRIQNDGLGKLQPKVVVLLIGTNNTGFERDGVTERNTTPEAVEGISSVVELLKRKLPKTKILLLGIFPRGQAPDAPQRLQVEEINSGIGKLQDGNRVYFEDLSAHFLNAKGLLDEQLMPDFLHLNASGYQVWADALMPSLSNLIKNARNE